MKIIMYRFILGMAIVCCLVWLGCSTTKQEAEVQFNFPAFMNDSAKAASSKLGIKGRDLYHLSCAKCHSTMVNGVEKIPDFTVYQLENYELRFSNPKHETEINEKVLTQEELRAVITFLLYRKKEK